MNKYCLITNDVEMHSIWFNSIRVETGDKVWKEGLPILLNIYSKYDIKSTFFFTGKFAEFFPDAVKMVSKKGHEIACHGYSHEIEHAFDVLPFKEQIIHLERSRKLLQDLSGQEIIAFRAPALRVNQHTPLALANAGFKIDSSIASQRFDMFLSFGSRKKLKWLFAPRLPYRTKNNNLFRKGNGSIIEIPISSLILPYIGTTMRIFPLITKIQHHILNLETNINSKPIVFDIHPNEFISEENSKRTIKRRNDCFIKYFLTDLIRARLKSKNLGKKAIPLFLSEIDFFKKRNFEFITLKAYCKEYRLL